MSELQKTPLYDAHVSMGARMVPFAGFEMPVSYSGIIAEHTAVRERVGLFDVSHMGEFVVSGPDTWEWLNRIVTNNVAGLPDDVGGEEPGQLLGPPAPVGDEEVPVHEADAVLQAVEEPAVEPRIDLRRDPGTRGTLAPRIRRASAVLCGVGCDDLHSSRGGRMRLSAQASQL